MDIYFKRGLVWGFFGTLAMTIIMITGTVLQMSPMPAPIPIAIAKWILGDLPKPILVIVGMLSHFVYGGMAGIIFSILLKDAVHLWKGLIWGIILWIGMQIIILPLLGWGFFGAEVSPKIAVATLILHLIYGGVLGSGSSWAKNRSGHTSS